MSETKKKIHRTQRLQFYRQICCVLILYNISFALLAAPLCIQYIHSNSWRIYFVQIVRVLYLFHSVCGFGMWMCVFVCVLLYAFLLITCTRCIHSICINRLVIRPLNVCASYFSVFLVIIFTMCICLHRFFCFFFSIVVVVLLFPIRTSSVCSGATFAAYCPTMIVCMCNLYMCTSTYTAHNTHHRYS